jgi:DNA uptake protein ComE-like DNA-binding protein
MSRLYWTLWLVAWAVLHGPMDGIRAAHAQTADSVAVDTTAPPPLDRVLDLFGGENRTTAQAAERIADLSTNPLNVNRASSAALAVLPSLSEADARRLVRHRRAHGPYETWRALGQVDGLSAEDLRAARPFLVVSPPGPSLFPSLRTIASNLSFSLTQRYGRSLDLGRGHRTGRFVGSPGRLTTRLRLRHKRRLELALTLDKDPGEPLRWAPSADTYGFDHVVGSFTLRDLGPVHTLVLGDFTTQFGQGVALWQGLRFGKGRDPVSPILQTGRGIGPYRSASEANFFRGAAATVALPAGLALTAFASRRHRDATIDSSRTGPEAPSGPLPVRSLSASGQHRTPSEIARKGTFGETTVGGALDYRTAQVHVGAAGYHARFGRPLRPGDRPSRRHRVAGRHASRASVYATATWADYTLFGEGAWAPGGTYGGLAGAALDGPWAEAVLLGRWYPPGLAGLYGNAFGDGSRPQNEQGMYTGLRLRVAEKWTLGMYFDQFRSPWLRFNVPRPTTGWEGRAVVEYAPRPWLSAYLQGRAQGQEQATERPGPGGRLLEAVQEERRLSLRGHVEYVFSDALTAQTRIEVTRAASSGTVAEGFYLSQGLRWSPTPSLQIDGGLAFFDTDGFAGRIYAYERDLRYSFSVPVFFDRGRRSYILARYTPVPSLTLEAKYGITTYAVPSTIGSGLNAYHGTSRRGLRAQLRWTL